MTNSCAVLSGKSKILRRVKATQVIAEEHRIPVQCCPLNSSRNEKEHPDDQNARLILILRVTSNYAECT